MTHLFLIAAFLGTCALASGCSSRAGDGAAAKGAASGLAPAPARARGASPAATVRSAAIASPSEKEAEAEEAPDAATAAPDDPTTL